MARTVYIETSVPSAYVDLREDPVSRAQHIHTVRWWRDQSRFFDLCCSEMVEAELSAGSYPGKDEALALLTRMRRLSLGPEVEGVARVYQRHLVMPRSSIGDATHLAAACVHEVDYLLTWNCSHLANAQKVEHIRVINMRLGLVTPTILTPEMLTGEESER